MTQPKDVNTPCSGRSLWCLFLLLCLLLPSLAAAPASQPDWRARFLAEAPAEYARLEKTVGRWEMSFVATYTCHPSDGSRTIVRQQIVNKCRTVFDDRLGGIRNEVTTISPTDKGGALVIGLNPEYAFEVDKQGNGPFVIAQFTPRSVAQTLERRWADQLQNYCALAAEDFDGTSLVRAVQSGAVTITAVSTVDLDGHRCVRFDCERVSKSGPRRGTDLEPVVVDPSCHWAVRSYERRVRGVLQRRVSNEYNPAITEVAFPKRIEEGFPQNYKREGRLWMQETMEFEDPKPSHAVASEFRLESVGLATPHAATHATPVVSKRKIGTLLLIIGGAIVVTLMVAFAFYRRWRSGKSR
jgi:hypothetical protein